MPNKFLSYCLLIACVALSISLSQNVSAKTIARENPEQLLKQATDELLAISQAARTRGEKGVDKDRQRYYDEAATILDQVIDTQYFARGVMATYASARLYNSLQTGQERAAFRARVQKFADALREVLIIKYADALLAFDGQRIEIENVTGGNGTDKVTLLQTIYDKGDKTYGVQYILQQQKDGQWLINNIIVEGVNLGATYRNQFTEAVKRNKGDVDYVVNHWKTLMTQPATEEKKSKAK